MVGFLLSVGLYSCITSFGFGLMYEGLMLNQHKHTAEEAYRIGRADGLREAMEKECDANGTESEA